MYLHKTFILVAKCPAKYTSNQNDLLMKDNLSRRLTLSLTLHTVLLNSVHKNTWDIIPDVKGIKNGWPCIVEIRGTQGCALVEDPARAVGECRDVAKAQP